MDLAGALQACLGPGNLHTSLPSPGTKTAGTGSYLSSHSWGWMWWMNRAGGHCWALAHSGRDTENREHMLKLWQKRIYYISESLMIGCEKSSLCLLWVHKQTNQTVGNRTKVEGNFSSHKVHWCVRILILYTTEHLYESPKLTSAISSCFRNQSWTISLRLCSSSNVCSSSTRSSSL